MITHSGKYDYSEVIFTNVSTHVRIICPHHGIFNQTPHKHIQGRGCPSCAKLSRSQSCIKFKSISDLHTIHCGKYEYPNFNPLTRLNDKIDVNCLNHGNFTIRLKNHLNGQGCAKCAHMNNGGAYHRMSSKDRGLIKNGFLYKLKLSNSLENFYKVGITTNPDQRLKSSKFSPYNVDIISVKKFSTLEEAYQAERVVLSEVSSYIPHCKFDGYTECYYA